MVPAIPYSLGSVAIFAVSSSTPSKESHLPRCSTHGRPQRSFQQRVMLPQSFTSALLQKKKRSCVGLSARTNVQALAAVGTDVATNEPNPTIAEEAQEQASDVSSSSPRTASSNQGRRTRPTRKSDMPPVKNEELLPGAAFTGKVRSIQPFGAFVDFGAFTDGLVHVSNLSGGFVKDVGSFVSVGQEVKVKILEANMETGRISLTMKDGEEKSRPIAKELADASETSSRDNKPRNPRKGGPKPPQKTSKFVKGQVLEGTVKNLTRSGAYISLPEGEEGFLPSSEEADGFSILGTSSLQAGQEVSVRVLRVARGQVTLTMKKEEDLEELNKMLNQGMVYAASNPFELAFRKNKDIASFLEERDRLKQAPEPVAEAETVSSIESVAEEESTAPTSNDEQSSVEAAAEEEEEKEAQPLTATTPEGPVSEDEGKVVAEEESVVPISKDEESSVEAVTEGEEEKEVQSSIAATVEEPVSEEPTSSEPSAASVEETPSEGEEEKEVQPSTAATVEEPVSEEPTSSEPSAPSVEDTPSEPAAAAISPSLVKQLREETGAGMMECKKALAESGGDLVAAQEFLRKKGLASADKKASRATAEGRIASYIHDSRIGVLVELNCETDFVSRGNIFKDLVEDIAMQVAACPQVQVLSTEDVPEEMIAKEREIEMQKEDLQSKPEQFRAKIVDGRMRKRLEELALLEQPYIKNDKLVIKDLIKQTIATIGENIKVARFVRFNLGEGLEKKSQDFAAEVAAQTAAKPPPSSPEATENKVEAPAQTEPAVEENAAPAVAVSAALVKQLREETGAGMMDCKKALKETGGDLAQAQDYLRKKGLASADKKSSRVAAEGRVGAYVHDARIGVLIEVNCETDFVGRSEKFKELVDELAMQVAACPQVKYVSVEEIPAEVVAKEKEIEMQREDLASKPENIREKIVEGRIAKWLSELALLEQPFIKDDSLLVKDLVKQTVAALGENIRVRRFARFTLGQSSG
ncbi:elongation factor Ts family protein isoform X1 [Wolffia australiana]